MKTLELNKMQQIEGSSDPNAIVCGIAIGLLFTPAIFWGVAGLALCLRGDSNGG